MAAHRTRARYLTAAALAALALTVTTTGTAVSAGPADGAPAVPIPQDPGSGSVKPYLGSSQPAHPIRDVRFAPRHPFMAVNGRSNLHDDAYQSDAGTTPGPLGHSPEVTSTLFSQECASVTFDSEGRLLTVCVGLATVDLRLLDPRTLDVLAEYPLPPRPASSASSPFTAFGGGGYFYLDQRDRVVVPTSDGHIQVIAETGTADAPALTLRRDYDVSADVGSSVILSALPDWEGRIWFVTGSGVVGTVDPHTGRSRSRTLPHGEGIGNSMAVDETGGVFVVSDQALYRFEATGSGAPTATWRRTYDAGTPAEAGPEPDRVGHHPDDRAPPRSPLRGHHRQRRPPHARAGVPRRPRAGPARGRCARSRCSGAATAPPTTRWSRSGAR